MPVAEATNGPLRLMHVARRTCRRTAPLVARTGHASSRRELGDTELFSDTAEPIGALIRRRRLERSLEDLEAPASGSITEIAFRWGFTDSSKFTRAFRREFGCTPSDARAARPARSDNDAARSDAPQGSGRDELNP